MFIQKNILKQKVIGYRNMIIDALKSKIVRKKENETYSMELGLCL